MIDYLAWPHIYLVYKVSSDFISGVAATERRYSLLFNQVLATDSSFRGQFEVRISINFSNTTANLNIQVVFCKVLALFMLNLCQFGMLFVKYLQ
jgi:hypothetical protein